MEETYPLVLEHNIQIQSYFINENRELSFPFLFSLIQEISAEHVHRCGIGWEHLRKLNMTWVLSKIRLQILRLPVWGENITLRTWGKMNSGVANPRDYEMTTKNGETLIKGTSIWLIINAIDGKIQKLAQFSKNLVFPENKSAIDERPSKIPAIDLTSTTYSGHVLSSDIDMNHHVNNSHYIQWTVDSISQTFRNTHRLRDVVVNYLSQAKLGDIYSIISRQLNDSTYATSIFCQKTHREFCRILSIWERIGK